MAAFIGKAQDKNMRSEWQWGAGWSEEYKNLQVER